MNIESYFKGKNILLTGTTGFVGKVVLEKVLRSLPDTGMLYIMVRDKKGMKPMERVL